MRRRPGTLPALALALALVLVLALVLLPACGSREEPAPEGGYLLYYCTQTETGPALAGEPWSPAEGAPPPSPEELLTVLLSGPYGEDLTSPFPRGTSVVSCRRDEEVPDRLIIRLSEQYGGLTDVSLTLADYAIALTLGQLEDVSSVEISAPGVSASARSHAVLVPEEALLEGDLAVGASSGEVPEDGAPGQAPEGSGAAEEAQAPAASPAEEAVP